MGWRLLIVALFVTTDRTLSAQEAPCPRPWSFCGAKFTGNCLSIRCCPAIGCCPDDYCSKPQPLIACMPRCGGPDDYCPKPAPCITGVPRCGACDDYCRKPLPNFLCPPWSPFLQCGPTEIICAPKRCR